MSDGRKNNPNMGGVRSGAGRPTKIKEENVLETINLYIDQHEAILLLKELMFDDKNLKALTLYMKYVYGVPTKTVDLNVNQEQPLFLLGAEGELL
jgi:hypothetical protein|tara:strand:- start:83 stop:367 length:285 start_codon:yes stop_codon:yes gene_type:complete